MPKVSVIMAVYNGSDYLREAIDSVLCQTYDDFELIIVDDASTDNSLEIIKSYKDERIVIICNENNMKLPRSLNKGISKAKGEYIVRMDADDICLPDRFAKQVDFMEKNLDIAASSGNYIIIDADGNVKKKLLWTIKSHRLTGELLNRYAKIPSPLVHPAAIIRKSVFDEGILYNPQYSSAQDYDLWLKINSKYKLGNISDVILKYRVHDKSISSVKREAQLNNAYKIFSSYTDRKISFSEFKCIMRFDFSLSPMAFCKKFYYVFSSMDIYFFRSVTLYALRWFLYKMNFYRKIIR